MRFTSTITVEIPLDDEAALEGHRERLIQMFEAVRAIYPEARLTQRRRGGRMTGARSRGGPPQHYTGRMRDYQ